MATAKQRAQRISESQEILRSLGFPPKQCTELCALTLLALTHVEPEMPWQAATNPLIGVSPIILWIQSLYKHKYAWGSRESFRKQAIHQFVQSGILLINPDRPDRATNSGSTAYQLSEEALSVIRSFGTGNWHKMLAQYLSQQDALATRYAAEREMTKVALNLPGGEHLMLSPGGQNTLVKIVWEQFCSRFAKGAVPLYIGDTKKKYAFADVERLAELGLALPEHGKLPDLLLYLERKDWLICIEVVKSHGPVNSKRREELRELLSDWRDRLVFISAFEDMQTFWRYAPEIAWETEVWIAAQPTHMVHFNGDRFLGPHVEVSAAE